MGKAIKREAQGCREKEPEQKRRRQPDRERSQSGAVEAKPTQDDRNDRRVLRSKYLALHNKINGERDDLERVDSKRFASIIKEVEDLHLQVQKPREQVADAEALLDIANTLVSSVRSQSSDGITPADFISCVVSQFGNPNVGLVNEENAPVSINWKEIGVAVSPIFRICNGFCTMLGPMDTEIKQRKVVVGRQRKRRTSPSKMSQPEEVDASGAEEKNETDKNMATMFEILRMKKRVKLENLILNRKSFAQTVENLFALSFLVKDGRVEISIDQTGSHLVLPRNAPAASLVMTGEAKYTHFVFRFDFSDWKLMIKSVPLGKELMPHRDACSSSSSSPPPPRPPTNSSQDTLSSTPIMKLTRNRGLTVLEDSVAGDPKALFGKP